MASANSMVLTLDLDGTAIKNEIERRVRQEIVDEMKKELKKVLYAPKRSYYSNRVEPAAWVVDLLQETLLEYKDEIVEMAAKNLATSMSRSKPFREKFSNIFEEEINSDSMVL